MKNNRLHQKAWVAFSALTFFFWLDMPAYAQSNPTQKNQSVQDNDTTRQELANFDQFLDKHHEIAEQLRRDPSLVNNQEFVKNHPALQDYLQQHPAVREEIKENPNAFMRGENRFDRREEDANRDRDLDRGGDRDRDRAGAGAGDRDTTHRELANFDHFLDSHRDVSEQLRKDPSLVDNKEFLKNHPDLQSYLQDHPAVREEIKENPNAFMQAENRFDRREEDVNRDRDRDRDRADDPVRDRDPAGDRDTTHQELANFDHFLDSHRDISEQLHKDPSLVDNKEFVKNHPALQSYLQDHPAVREEIKENPNAFMQAENRLDRREEDVNRDRDRDLAGDRDRDPGRDRDRTGDRDTTHQELANFDRFLDSHREISGQLRKDPSLVNNQEFVKNHPALQSYLQDHPAVREEIKENPNAFMQAENRLDRREEDVNRDRDHDLAGDRDRDRAGDRDRTGDRDTTHRELANFDHFLDSHREISEQLHKNPSLVDNKEFVKNHPALQSYLQDHPAVREEIKENPNSFMQAENRLDHREQDLNRDRDRHVEGGMDRDALHRNFGEFLGGHSDVAQQLSKNPSLVKNQEFVESHPELKEYLNAHPDVRQQLLANPQSFMKSAQQFSNSNSVVKTPTTSPKPKQ